MQYVDCDRAEKHGNLCLGYGYEEIDEPCEQCSNCIKCESGSYQLGETEKDDQLTKAKEIIKGLLSCCRNYPQENAEKMEQAKKFLKGEDIILEDAQAGNSPFDADEVFNKEMKAYPNRKVK